MTVLKMCQTPCLYKVAIKVLDINCQELFKIMNITKYVTWINIE